MAGTISRQWECGSKQNRKKNLFPYGASGERQKIRKNKSNVVMRSISHFKPSLHRNISRVPDKNKT